MPGYTISAPFRAGPPSRSLRLVALDEPIVTHVWEAGGDVTVHAVLLDERPTPPMVADLYATGRGGEPGTFQVDHYSDLSDPLTALLSEVTEGRWAL